MQSPFAAMRGPVAPILAEQPKVTLPEVSEPRLLRVEIFYRALPKNTGWKVLESAQRAEQTFTLRKGWTTNGEIKATDEKFITARVNELRKKFLADNPENTALFRGGPVERDTIQVIVRTSYPVQEEGQ